VPKRAHGADGAAGAAPRPRPGAVRCGAVRVTACLTLDGSLAAVVGCLTFIVGVGVGVVSQEVEVFEGQTSGEGMSPKVRSPSSLSLSPVSLPASTRRSPPCLPLLPPRWWHGRRCTSGWWTRPRQASSTSATPRRYASHPRALAPSYLSALVLLCVPSACPPPPDIRGACFPVRPLFQADEFLAKLGDKKTASLGIGLVLFTAKVCERDCESSTGCCPSPLTHPPH
jgi:hypothetical protein